MEQLRSAGATVGEYVGNGQGETEISTTANDNDEDRSEAEPEADVDDDYMYNQDCRENINENKAPLLFLYDCETTGLGIYTEHITEIAAKVVGVPHSAISQPTFSSLVKTSRNISTKGITYQALIIIILVHIYTQYLTRQVLQLPSCDQKDHFQWSFLNF